MLARAVISPRSCTQLAVAPLSGLAHQHQWLPWHTHSYISLAYTLATRLQLPSLLPTPTHPNSIWSTLYVTMPFPEPSHPPTVCRAPSPALLAPAASIVRKTTKSSTYLSPPFIHYPSTHTPPKQTCTHQPRPSLLIPPTVSRASSSVLLAPAASNSSCRFLSRAAWPADSPSS
jgi:hypothetical protein